MSMETSLDSMACRIRWSVTRDLQDRDQSSFHKESAMTEYSANYLGQQRSDARDYAASTFSSAFSPPLSQTNPAMFAFQRLAQCILRFEEKCDDEHEIGVRLFTSNTEVTFHLRDLNYYTPNILNFHGINEHGEELQLIQDVSQLNILLVPMKTFGEKPVRIGDRLDQSEER